MKVRECEPGLWDQHELEAEEEIPLNDFALKDDLRLLLLVFLEVYHLHERDRHDDLTQNRCVGKSEFERTDC